MPRAHPAQLDNSTTSVAARVPSTLDVAPAAMAALLERARPKGPVQTLPAQIGGLRVDLVTDNAHLADFWQANWPTVPEVARELRPHAVLHALPLPGEAAHAYYCPGRDEALLANTDYYGQCKSWALGISAAILQRRFGIHSIHGAAVELDGQGIVVVGGTGSGKSTQVATLCKQHGARLLGDDWTFVDPAGPGLRIFQPERMLYIRTDNAANDPALRDRLRGARIENATTRLGDCTSPACLGGNCMLKQGKPYCLWGHPNARALVPREWLAGPAGLADEATLGRLVVLYRDAKDPRKAATDPKEVLEFLRKGPSEVRPGAGPPEKWGTMSSTPYYNPYLLAPDAAAQDAAFTAELRLGALLLNTAHLDIQKTAKAIATGNA